MSECHSGSVECHCLYQGGVCSMFSAIISGIVIIDLARNCSTHY